MGDIGGRGGEPGCEEDELAGCSWPAEASVEIVRAGMIFMGDGGLLVSG